MNQDHLPDYETYDYATEWEGKQIEDSAEKAVMRMWLRPSGSCLELGGGFGRITTFLESFFGTVVMLDFSQRNLRTAGRRLGRTGLVRSEISRQPIRDSTFDCIVMVRVVHHLPEPELVLSEVKRVAKNGATLIMSVPNTAMGKTRSLRENSLVGRGPQGHLIYAAPVKYYTRSFSYLGAKGTGLFENSLGVRLHKLTFLHLLDVATSSLWQLKPTVFLRLRVDK
jgi:ubiquinone/menaquinone biosynthesis C-methylase UbiE